MESALKTRCLSLLMLGLSAAPAGAFTLAVGDVSTGADNITQPLLLAEEANVVGDPSDSSGVFDIVVQSTLGGFLAGTTYLVTVNVTGGSYSTSGTAGNVVSNENVVSIINNVSMQGDPREGDTEVTYLVQTRSGVFGTSFGLRLPLTYHGCGTDLSVSVTIEQPGVETVPFENGTASLDVPAVQCVDVFTFGGDGTNERVLLEPPNYSRFEGDKQRADIQSPLLSISSESVVYYLTDTPEVRTFEAGDWVRLTVQAEDATGLGFYETLPFVGNEVTWTYDFTAPSGTIALPSELEVTNDGTPILQQNLFFTDIFLNFADPELNDESYADVFATQLYYGGASCPVIESVTDDQGAMGTTIYIVELDEVMEDYGIIANITNATDAFYDGMYFLDNVDFTPPDLVITGGDLFDTIGPFTRADVELQFPDSLNVDCRREISSPANQVMTFGRFDQES